MAIAVHIPGPLLPFSGGRRRVLVEGGGGTVGGVLAALGRDCPGVVARVLQEDGAIRQHVNIFVGAESVRWTGGLATPVADGGEVSILPAVSGGAVGGVPTVIFACIHNAGRSQMAAAWFQRLADPAKARAISAGTRPAERVHPEVQAAMLEAGIDLSGARPRKLTAELAAGAARLFTLGCGEECPAIPGVPVEDWPLPDPKGQGIDAVRGIRDEVRRRVEALLRREGWAARS